MLSIPLPVPEVVELRELPREFEGLVRAPAEVAQQAARSVALAHERHVLLQVDELHEPSLSVWALFR